MTRQAHCDLSFDVPDEWENKSIVAFAAPRQPGKVIQPNIVVTRDTLPAGQTLQTYATKQLATASKGLPRFALADTRGTTVGGMPAIAYSFTWEGDSGPLAQRQLMIACKEFVYSVTVSVHRGEQAAFNPIFDKILSTIEFGEPAPPPRI